MRTGVVARDDVVRWVFGDRYGLVLWLGLLLWFGLTWRVGIFIQDTYATANTLVALADGQLHVTELRYSLTFGSQPGLHQYNGRLYGRNYGQLFLAVPLVWFLEGASVVADPRLLLAGLWVGLGLVVTIQASRLPTVDRNRVVTVGTAAVAILFVGSLATGTELGADQLALVAYQLSTMVAAATLCLFAYRLLALWHGRRVGLAAGLGVGLATPIGFWATLPKRHTLVAALVVAGIYAFAVSRQAEGRTALWARAGAYGLFGLVTSVHAFEALFIVVVLCAIDLLTARSNSPRQLLAIAFVFLLATTPMLATNYAITGNPAEPPRLLPGVSGDVEFTPGASDESSDSDGSESATGADGASDSGGDSTADSGGSDTGDDGTGDGGGGSTEGGSADSGDSPGPNAVDRILAVVSAVVGAVGSVFASVAGAVRSALASIDPVVGFASNAAADGIKTAQEPERLYHTFVRSGNIPSLRYRINGYEVIELALLEAMPALGALLSLPVLFGRRIRESLMRLTGPKQTRQKLSDLDPRAITPRRQTDLLVVSLAVVLTIVYLPRLPLFSQLTVRYLHPIVPLAAYGVCRLPAVRAAATDAARRLVAAYAVSVVAATIVVLGGIVAMDLALGEAVQYHALWNLTAATVCAVAVTGRTLWPERVSAKTAATGIALPAGFATAYLLLAGLVYFRYGTYAFDVVRVAAELLPSL